MGCIVKESGKIQGYTKSRMFGLGVIVFLILASMAGYYDSTRPTPVSEYSHGDVVSLRGSDETRGVVRSIRCGSNHARCSYTVMFKEADGKIRAYTMNEYELQLVN